jgi:glycosyltransferase involved in cell wall biosynthesis
MDELGVHAMHTVALVTNIPRPYRSALYGPLKRQLEAESLALRVLYTSDPSKHLRRGSPPATVSDPDMESYVPGLSVRIGYERVSTVPTGLRKELDRLHPRCVVVGGFSIDSAAAARWCRAHGTPYLIWSGAWPGQKQRANRLRLWIRKRLVRQAAAYVAYGSAAADYLVALGAPPERVFCAWNTVDLEGIATAARAASGRRPALVEKYGLATRNLLYVGSITASKGVPELVVAALALDLVQPDWALHFLGTGPLEEQLKDSVRQAGREASFRFHGLRPASDVAEMLGLADGLFLPTKHEAWGLVINEAMACGVPVVVSSLAGATRDLIKNGVTGFVVEPDDQAGLTGMMARMVREDPDCIKVGQAGAKAVREKASLERAASGLVAAVRCALVGDRGD